MIYFIQEGTDGPVKIGYSKNVEERLKQLQTGHAQKLYLLLETFGDIDQEKNLHKTFEEYRLRGEWFELSAEILDFIDYKKGKPQMFRYELCPIDYFTPCLLLSEYRERIYKTCDTHPGELEYSLSSIEKYLPIARSEIKKCQHYDGTPINDVYILPIPPNNDGPDMMIGFMFKQSDNGSTFIISPVELPHLNEYRT